MAFDFGSLEPRIHEILSAPGTDLATISAKRVRRQLLELDPSLTPEFLRENKEEVDAVIAAVFEMVSGGQGVDAASEGVEQATAKEIKSRKWKQEDENEVDEDEDETTQQSPPPKKPKKSSKNGRELSDAELARKLSSEINGRSTRTGAKGRGGSAGKKAARTKKSAATVDSDESDDGNRKRTRKQSSGGAKGGFGKEFSLSNPLASLLNIDKLSRPQVVKQLWVYIKENQLQNPENKREILCDTNMRAIFGVDKIDMFKMNKVLGQHLHEIE